MTLKLFRVLVNGKGLEWDAKSHEQPIVLMRAINHMIVNFM